jgi:hypothetical protein
MTEPINLPPADVALLIAWHEDMAAEENLNEATRDKHRGSAGELRRLHAEVERLRDVLTAIVDFVDGPAEEKRPDVFALRMNAARNALKETK